MSNGDALIYYSISWPLLCCLYQAFPLQPSTPLDSLPNRLIGGQQIVNVPTTIAHKPTIDEARLWPSSALPVFLIRKLVAGMLKVVTPEAVFSLSKTSKPDCLSISIVDPRKLEPLIGQVHDFFEDCLELPVKKSIPIFFVDANEMNTRGTNTTTLGRTICEGDTINIVKRCVRRGADIEVVTETKNLKPGAVKAIILLFGYPRAEFLPEQEISPLIRRRILGATLAHEMVHALIRLQGWRFFLERKVEEGICEAIAYEWLKYTASDYDPSYTQKDAKIAEILTAYHKSLIEQGIFGSCGAEFWKARHAIKKYGLKRTLKRVARLRNIPE
ncbi:hypothetical protein Vadar_023396 [Vaccinium darrowii]|nr:hypothetical protein Vadar_023396 [Vaccinium darrowii]